MDDQEILAAQRSVYRTNFLAHGDTPLGTYQNSQLTQYLRFEALIRHIAAHFGEHSTIHDVGSGLCDLYDYLRQVGLADRLTYSGTEIVEEMNELARGKYPGIELLNRNFLDDESYGSYDFIVLSGTLNIHGGVEETAWKDMCLALVDKMFARANKGIAFNFLTSYRTFSNPDLFYFDPREVFDHATTRFSRFVHLDAAYPLYECTVTVFRKDYIASLNGHPDLAKYFR